MNHSINPNDRVRVKLTATGKRLIVEHINEINEAIRLRGDRCTYRAKVPEWDEDGWVNGQFHDLMNTFGGSCWGLGMELPFTEMKRIG